MKPKTWDEEIKEILEEAEADYLYLNSLRRSDANQAIIDQLENAPDLDTFTSLLKEIGSTLKPTIH